MVGKLMWWANGDGEQTETGTCSVFSAQDLSQHNIFAIHAPGADPEMSRSAAWPDKFQTSARHVSYIVTNNSHMCMLKTLKSKLEF